ncbi:S53 family peptidase [Aureispira anguillae]|uniref:S53 family peptidase n=1 Tax=Aureispira anguillae TaxID=2864201 RepID=A0A915VKG7_9BACT|nr:S53 family peptidase [Aureispira anguillae]BDS09693.1 S53 family peptidase [Aureispira anguillae]
MLNSTIEVRFYSPPASHSENEQKQLNDLLSQHPKNRNYISFSEYQKRFSIPKDEVNNLLKFAAQKEIKAEFNPLKREVVLHATANLFQSIEDKRDSVTSETLNVLNNLGDLTFDTTKAIPETEVDSDTKKPHRGFIKQHFEQRPTSSKIDKTISATTSYSPLDFIQAYNFPEGDGKGQTIGLIELGGTFTHQDMTQFFQGLGLEVPTIEVVGAPSKVPANENVEVTSDIQIAGALAPKAKLVIYYGKSIIEAVKTALSDTKNNPTILSISWAGSEFNYSETELQELNSAFYEAALRGITVIAASGDHGAYNGLQYPNVNVPTNNPFVLGCGGTTIQIQNGQLTQNRVWYEQVSNTMVGTGGGYSRRIPIPAYQQTASNLYLSRHPQYVGYNPTNGRAIPDIAANAAMASAYKIVFNGAWMPMGGTSLSTPLWAALIARLNQSLGYQLGFINNLLYQLENSNAFIQAPQGNNGLYIAAYGWDPCTGLGSPNGKALLQAIQQLETTTEE